MLLPYSNNKSTIIEENDEYSSSNENDTIQKDNSNE